MTNDRSWVYQAACAGRGDAFFPEFGGTMTEAKKMCASCPVRQQCEEYGKSLLDAETPLYRGLWGGKTVPELRIEAQANRPVFVQGSCALAGCSRNLVPSGSNHPRKYCSFKCKKKAEHLRAAARAKELR